MSSGDKFREELIETARRIGTPGKGILAADESTGTIGKRFEKINLENNAENRRQYRQMLFTTESAEQYICGVILYEETLYQKTDDGIEFVDLFKKKGIIPGIKVDSGLKPIRGTDGETYTQGLDDLDARCKKYYEKGARFAKWRAAIKINKGGQDPSPISIAENARGLARYAAICQDNGLVPIVEPEVLVLEGDHDIKTSVRVTQKVVAAVYYALSEANVLLEGTILKTNMVLPGEKGEKASTAQIAHATLTVLQRTTPAAVPTINFLSGGMSEEEASVNLNAINALEGKRPWNVSFSYGRALQATALKTWGGKKENIPAAQKAYLERAKANSEASVGKYKGGAGGADASSSLFQSGYVY